MSMLSGITSGFAGQASLLVSGVVVARILGVEGRGQLALFALFPTLLVQLGGLGLPAAVTYFVAQEPARAGPIIQSLTPTALLQATGLTALNVGFLFLFLHSEGEFVLIAAAISSIVVAPILLQVYGLALLQGLGQFLSLHILRLVSPVVYALSVLALLVGGIGNLQTVAAIWATSNLLMAGLIAIFVWHAIRNAPAPSLVPSRRAMISFGGKSLLASTSVVDTLRIDQAVAGLLLSPTALGLYVVGSAFSNLPRILSTSIGVVAYPTVAAHKSSAHAGRTMLRFFAVTMLLCGVIVLILELLVSHLVPLFFGQEFEGAVPISRILLIGALLYSARRILSDCIRGAGQPTLGSLAEMISWIVLLPAMAIMTPLWGTAGVAAALTVSSGTAFFSLLLLVLRNQRLEPSTAELTTAGVNAGISEANNTGHSRQAVEPETLRKLLAIPCLLLCLLLGTGIALMSTFLALILVGVAAVGLATVVIVRSYGFTRIFEVLLGLSVLTLAMNDIRVTSWATVSDVFLAAALLLSPFALHKERRDLSLLTAVLIGLGAIILGGLIGSFFAQDTLASMSALLRFGLASFGVIILFNIWSPTLAKLEPLIWLWIASAVISAIYGFVVGDDRFHDRLSGLATHPNHFALICVMAIAPALALTRAGSWRRVAGLSASLILASAVILSGSRAGLIGLTSIVLCLAFVSRDFTHIGAAALAILVVFCASLVGVISLPAGNALERLEGRQVSTTESNNERISRLGKALDQIESHPFTGVGLEDARSAHNIYFQMWTSTGLLGLAGYLLILAWLLGWPLLSTKSHLLVEHPLAIGLVLGILSYVVIGLFQNQIWDRYIWFSMAFAIAGLNQLDIFTTNKQAGPVRRTGLTPTLEAGN
jgi:O-antigen/teichoic acid export membrane protein/O-antigen ligase